jgi:GMP synthase (glutamine-hydrolysing)
MTWKPKGIILSDGPYSVYDNDAPHSDPAIFELGVPILGIPYGLQEFAWQQDRANVVAGTERDFGQPDLQASKVNGHVARLFKDL